MAVWRVPKTSRLFRPINMMSCHFVRNRQILSYVLEYSVLESSDGVLSLDVRGVGIGTLIGSTMSAVEVLCRVFVLLHYDSIQHVQVGKMLTQRTRYPRYATISIASGHRARASSLRYRLLETIELYINVHLESK
jgi:hypothetical protein